MRNNRMDDDESEFPEDFFPGTPEEGDEDPQGEEYQQYQDQSNIEAEMDLTAAFLRKKILFRAVKMCQLNWFWSFRSLEYKMIHIHQTYRVLLSMLEEGPSPEPEKD